MRSASVLIHIVGFMLRCPYVMGNGSIGNKLKAKYELVVVPLCNGEWVYSNES